MEMARTLGIAERTWKYWYAKKPSLRMAVKEGRGARAKKTDKATYNGQLAESSGQGFCEYILERLPHDLKAIWDQIDTERAMEVDAGEFIESLFRDQGKAARQHLWMHALMLSNFNASEACRKVNISREVLDKWAQESPGFRKLWRGVEQIKKDFVEGEYWAAVRRGEISAILEGMRALHGDKGFGRSVKVKHEGSMTHLHEMISVEELAAIPLEDRRRIYEAAKAKALPPKEVAGTDSAVVLDAI